MDLKKAIVVRNEFSNVAYSREHSRELGSRGGSFDAYILGYMARDEASDPLFPVQIETNYVDVSFEEYSQQLEDRLYSRALVQEPSLYLSGKKLSTSQNYDGLAFDEHSLSLSYADVIKKSKAIQEAFEEGHSVQKFVVSFKDDYLKMMNVLPEDFQLKQKGDHFGQVDQFKLRTAIQNGMDMLCQEGAYASPLWIGLIQLDTKSVHAHMVLVDSEFSEKRLTIDGTDRGKINSDERTQFRLGCHQSLELQQSMHLFQSQVALNELSYDQLIRKTHATSKQVDIIEQQRLKEAMFVAAEDELEPELVYKIRKKKVKEFIAEEMNAPKSPLLLNPIDQSITLNGLQFVFMQIQQSLDLDVDASYEQWLELSAEKILAQTSTPNYYQDKLQALHWRGKIYEEAMHTIDKVRAEPLSIETNQCLDYMQTVCKGFIARSQLLPGDGYDDWYMHTHFPLEGSYASDQEMHLETIRADLIALESRCTLPEDVLPIFRTLIGDENEWHDAIQFHDDYQNVTNICKDVLLNQRWSLHALASVPVATEQVSPLAQDTIDKQAITLLEVTHTEGEIDEDLSYELVESSPSLAMDIDAQDVVQNNTQEHLESIVASEDITVLPDHVAIEDAIEDAIEETSLVSNDQLDVSDVSSSEDAFNNEEKEALEALFEEYKAKYPEMFVDVDSKQVKVPMLDFEL